LPSHPCFQILSAGETSVGRVRDHNEDTFRLNKALGLFIVADGMGGHNAGEVASRLAALSLENCFASSRSGPLPTELTDDPRALSSDARDLVASARKANADVFEISKSHAEHRGMGTTLVAVHVSATSGDVHVVHVGDSRCYRVRDGSMEQLTRDHSLVSDAIAFKPDITEAELAMFPKNVISRALGRGASVQIDARTEPVRAGDVFLLCSDGLSGMLDDAAILSCIVRVADPQAACRELIEAANVAGGTDNVTAVLVRVEAGSG
jgi:protein phosphatase